LSVNLKTLNSLRSPASQACNTGDFVLFPAGGSGQVAALLREISPLRAIIEEMVAD
jgi:hypothetical protein